MQSPKLETTGQMYTKYDEMKVFLDTAKIEEIKPIYETGLVSGITTNPTLVKSVDKSYKTIITEILNECPDIESVSVEVEGKTCDELLANASEYYQTPEKYYAYDPRVTIKLPCTVEGIKACKILSTEEIKTNVTLVFSVAQAIMAMIAGATYISPFVGRMNDNSFSGVELVKAIAGLKHRCKTKVLAASLRDAHHASRCMLGGADIITLPPSTFYKMYDSVLTREGLEIFERDFNS